MACADSLSYSSSSDGDCEAEACMMLSLDDSDMMRSKKSNKTKPSGDEMTELVSLQKSNGMFEVSSNNWEDSVFNVYAGSHANVKKSCPSGAAFNVWLTALAIKILEIKMSEKKELWKLVVKKSKKYLIGQLANNDEQCQIILAKAEECIKNN